MSGSAVGVETVFGIATESVYGTPVTVSRFYEIVSETLARKNNVISSNGLRGGTRNLRRGSRRVISSRDAAGDVKFEVATTGFGKLFAAIMGGTPTITGAGDPYTQTYALGTDLGKSLTVQKQLRDPSGTAITTLTYPGSKVTSAEFSIAANKILELTVGLDCRDETNLTAAAVASYGSTSLFNFEQAVLSIAGSPVANVLDATVKLEAKMDTARFFLGSAGLKSEPQDNDFPAVSGVLNAEVLDESLWTLFAGDTAASLSLVFTAGTHSLTITVPEVHLTGETPKVSGFGVVKIAVPYEGAYDGSSPGMTLVYVTSDALS